MKKIHLRKIEYPLIFICIGLLVIFPIIENAISTDRPFSPYGDWMTVLLILIGYGLFIILLKLVLLDVNHNGARDSLDLSSPEQLGGFIFFFLPFIVIGLIETWA
jgi:hypothetical protein